MTSSADGKLNSSLLCHSTGRKRNRKRGRHAQSILTLGLLKQGAITKLGRGMAPVAMADELEMVVGDGVMLLDSGSRQMWHWPGTQPLKSNVPMTRAVTTLQCCLQTPCP